MPPFNPSDSEMKIILKGLVGVVRLYEEQLDFVSIYKEMLIKELDIERTTPDLHGGKGVKYLMRELSICYYKINRIEQFVDMLPTLLTSDIPNFM